MYFTVIPDQDIWRRLWTHISKIHQNSEKFHFAIFRQLVFNLLKMGLCFLNAIFWWDFLKYNVHV